MPKPIQTAVLTCLLMLLPVIATGQTCKTISIPASTPTRQFTIHNNGTVADTKTGLMWKRCSEGQIWNGATCSGSATYVEWHIALQQVQTHNLTGFVGFKDWRLPNVKELFSIVEKQCAYPTINLAIFPNTVINPGGYTGYWSSSPSFGTANHDPWKISFAWGSTFTLSDLAIDYQSFRVRLVRGGQ